MSMLIALFAMLFASTAMAQDATTQDVAAAPTPLTPEEQQRMQKLQGDLEWAKEQMKSYQNDVAKYCDEPYNDSKKTAADKALHAACIDRHNRGYQLENLSEFVRATQSQLSLLQAKLKASQTVQNEATVEPPRYEDDRDMRELSNGYDLE